jgi:hypothetical protein
VLLKQIKERQFGLWLLLRESHPQQQPAPEKLLLVDWLAISIKPNQLLLLATVRVSLGPRRQCLFCHGHEVHWLELPRQGQESLQLHQNGIPC